MALVPQLPIGLAETGVMWGNSLTAGEPPWYRDLIGMGAKAVDIGRTPGRGGYYRRGNIPPVTWIKSGTPGDTAQLISQSVASRLTVYAAKFAIGEWGLNDVLQGVSDVNFATYNNSAWDQALLAQPNLKVAACSIFSNGEDTPNGSEANVAAKNAIMSATMARVGGTFVDVRTQFLAWQIANNPTHTFIGQLTVDGYHLTPLGVKMWGIWAYQYIKYLER